MTKFFSLTLTVLASFLLLQGCSSQSGWETPPASQPQAATTAPATAINNQPGGAPLFASARQTPPLTTTLVPPPVLNARKIKVALLVPLSGQGAEIGESISNAAQMALFDSGSDGFELSPRDTHGTPAGAAAAAQDAIRDGAQLILGPLMSDDVRAVTPIAQAANINVIAFTTDLKQAGPNTFIMGFVPTGQVQRVVSYAASKGIRSIGVIAPQTEYGNVVLNAYTSQAALSGIQTVDVLRTRPGDPNISTALQKFSNSDARKKTPGLRAPFDAVFMPVGGTDAQTIGNLLSYHDLDPQSVRRLGTGLWDDAIFSHETNLAGGWFAAPDPAARKVFEQKYQSTYGSSPSRLASLGYDATALAAVLARNSQSRSGLFGGTLFDRAAITNPNGFSGIDGIFRFGNDGLAERGLAILELRNGTGVVVDPAPRNFQSSP
ncbi:MAG: extracellular ligand-binding receptor [Micavibrio sp.]|nr:extracellular ligand-binding receptor [Micavibrio sp.]